MAIHESIKIFHPENHQPSSQLNELYFSIRLPLIKLP